MLRLVNRPSSETDVLNGVKDAINDAIMYLQRNQAFAMTERLASITYTASAASVALTSVGSGSDLVRDVISVQQVSASGVLTGKPLKLTTYEQIQVMRNRYARRNSSADVDLSNDTLSGWTIEDAYRSDKMAFVVGNAIGLYPVPTETVYLYVNYHKWMPVLSADADTNFFLDYAMDVVQTLAAKRMLFYMRDVAIYSPTQAEVDAAVATLLAWDAQFKLNMSPVPA